MMRPLYRDGLEMLKKEEAGSHVTAASEAGKSHEHEGGDVQQQSNVKTIFQYYDGKITITLNDSEGNLVDALKVNHEKLLHLIVVDDHLNQYYHLHPEKVGKGKFQIVQELKDGSYKAFIDIKPEKLSYHVTPVSFKVGEQQDSHSHNSLKVDSTLVKTVDGETTEMDVSSFEAGSPVTLNFKLNESKLEPYLGAAGHVIILNEEATQYLHVHPLNDNEPIFETEFDQPGVYKIWAEFKQDGKVRVFPYVITVK